MFLLHQSLAFGEEEDIVRQGLSSEKAQKCLNARVPTPVNISEQKKLKSLFIYGQ